jgi:hypothetical protein
MKSLIDVIKRETNAPRNDGMLHFSSHLMNDRHTVLYWHHGYPEGRWDRPWANTLPLLQGTAMHEQLHKIMHEHHSPYASEIQINVDEFKYPWTGTVDAYIEDENGNVLLLDYKTISGSSFSFLDGPKPEHLMQVSAYFHFGMPRVSRVGILYLPTSPDYRRRWHEPVFYEVKPLPREAIVGRINAVEAAIDAYPYELPDYAPGTTEWKYSKKYKHWEHWSRPHYSSLFCPWKDDWENDKCNCSSQKPELLEVSDEAPEETVA